MTKVVVIGAGMVGLSTAWFLRELGADVVVLDRAKPGGAASWGNAGWAAPALTMPLPDPAILATGAKAALSPASPVYIPPNASLRTLRFLGSFVRHCTPGKWKVAMAVYTRLNELAIGAFEELPTRADLKAAEPLLVAFASDTDRQALVAELRHAAELGQGIEFHDLDGDQARLLEPALGDAVSCGVRIEGQRYIDPRSFVRGLADAAQQAGVQIRTGCEVADVSSDGRGSRCRLTTGEVVAADATVIASGAWLGTLARQFGVKTLVQAGRGYSFTVQPDPMPRQPVYFPTQRIACTPIAGGFRVAGMMEFARPEHRLNPKRIDAIVNAARPMLSGVDWSQRTDEWVGSRPCTPDGLPLVGRTRVQNVYVCGGHGMWGIALGPLTGRLLANQVMTGQTPKVMQALNPTR